MYKLLKDNCQMTVKKRQINWWFKFIVKKISALKKNSFLMCVSHLFPHYFQTMLPISDVWVSLPQRAILCDISWIFYDLTTFWYYLPKDSVRYHRLRVQSCETAHHFRCQWQVVGLHVIYNFCLIWFQVRGSLDLLLFRFDY